MHAETEPEMFESAVKSETSKNIFIHHFEIQSGQKKEEAILYCFTQGLGSMISVNSTYWRSGSVACRLRNVKQETKREW